MAVSVSRGTRGARAAAASRFRKPCIMNPVARSSRRTGWCNPAVALNGVRASDAAATNLRSQRKTRDLVERLRQQPLPRLRARNLDERRKVARSGAYELGLKRTEHVEHFVKRKMLSKRRDRLSQRDLECVHLRTTFSEPSDPTERFALRLDDRRDGRIERFRQRGEGRRRNDESPEHPGVRAAPRVTVLRLRLRERQRGGRKETGIVDQRAERGAYRGEKRRR